jgi:acetylornithine deacetylase/succinyl-diaminopimelate desuccinylase-like protein
MRDKALIYAKTYREDMLTSLQEILRIPSISTLPEHKPDIERTAQWLVNKFSDIGMENIAIMPTGGQPVVYADWLNAGPDVPTLLIYGHYDVQPTDPLDEWVTPPFEPTIKGDKLYCRGADDNKGQHHTHISAIESYLKSVGCLPINIKFMVEGEEEIGSPHLRKFMETHQDLFKADVALISDSGIIDPQTPAIATSVRGLAYMEITLRGSKRDLHSGSYGGAVENPLNAMVRILASLHDEQNMVNIPGFYDKVRELTPTEQKLFDHGLVTDKDILAETGAPALWGETGYDVATRIGSRPTLDIHGIKGGFIGEGQKTVIPAVASAKVSMRLVPNQNANEIVDLFTQHIRKIAPKTMELSIEKLSAENGAMVDVTVPAIDAASQAYQLGFGKAPVLLQMGGTLPVVTMFIEILKAPVVLMGFGLPDDDIHAPNEKFHLPNFYRGIDTAIHYYDILGQM